MSSIQTRSKTRPIRQSQEEIELQTLLDWINKLLIKTEFDVNNGEYIYKRHCNEFRRQVQLAK